MPRPVGRLRAIPQPIPAAQLGIVLLLAGLDALGQGLQFKMLAAAEDKIRHRDRGILVWNHHQDDVLIAIVVPSPATGAGLGVGPWLQLAVCCLFSLARRQSLVGGKS